VVGDDGIFLAFLFLSSSPFCLEFPVCMMTFHGGKKKRTDNYKCVNATLFIRRYPLLEQTEHILSILSATENYHKEHRRHIDARMRVYHWGSINYDNYSKRSNYDCR